jgi:glycosyltransferase involved in cell wall biosynthesis
VKIWSIQTGERLPLQPGMRMMRSGLLAKELARRDHEVTWWASAFDHYAKEWIDPAFDGAEIWPNLNLRLLRGTGYRENLSVARFIDHARVAREFSRQARELPRPDIIVAAMPDYRIAYAALGYAKARGIPFVLDLRDRWPWDFLDYVPLALRPLARLALASDFWMARRLLGRADSLVTMMETWGHWIGRYRPPERRQADRVFYLGSEAPKPDSSRVREPTRAALARAEGRWPILFVGAFNNRYWPKMAVEAFKLLDRSSHGASDPLLILAGDGDFRGELEKLAAGDPGIVLPGYVNDAEIAALVECARVGLVTGNGDFEAMPNKVFTYLSGGLPILSSLGGELEAVLSREGVGLTYRGPDAWVAAFEALMDDEPRRAEMARKAQAVFDERYEAGCLYGDYAGHIERVATGKVG